MFEHKKATFREFVFILTLLLVYGRGTVLASDFFDDFSSSSLDNKWVVEDNGFSKRTDGSVLNGIYGWYISDNKLTGESGYNEVSLISPKVDFNLKNFEFSCKAVNINGVDQSFWFKVSQDKQSYYEINYRYKEPSWPQDHNKVSLRKVVNGSQNYFSQIDMGVGDFPDLTPGTEYNLKVIFTGGYVKILLNDITVINYLDDSPIDSGNIYFRNWGGSFISSRLGRIKNTFDNVSIIEKQDERPLDNTKVIILPGLGASWNPLGAFGVSDPNLKWTVPSFINVYDNLVDAFVSNGFERDKNIFVWGYDWRRPVSEISTNFNNYLASVTDNDDQIILVGHSLGGLVARWWYQDHSSDSRVRKVITLGSPHYGTLNAYKAWNGGEIPPKDISSILFNILILLNKGYDETNIDVIKRFAPVTFELQPVFDFSYKGNQLFSYKNMEKSNTSLDLKNLGLNSSSVPKLYTIGGKGVETDQFYKLGERTYYEKLLDLWPDGRIVEKVSSQLGDGTVLLGSALVDTNYFEIESNHGDLTTKAISKVMEILSLDSGLVTLSGYDNLEDSLVLYIASPAHLEVNCGSNNYLSDSMGFVVINKNQDSCQVSVVADGQGGNYKLIVGNNGIGSWSKYSGEVLAGQRDVYSFNNNGLLVSMDNTYDLFKNYCQKLLLTYANNQDLLDCIEFSDNKDARNLIKSVFNFRHDKRQYDLSWEMLDKLIPLIVSDSVTKTEAYWLVRNGNSMFKLVSAMGEIRFNKSFITDSFGKNSYEMAYNIFKPATEEFNKGDYGLVKARFEIARMILNQVW